MPGSSRRAEVPGWCGGAPRRKRALERRFTFWFVGRESRSKESLCRRKTSFDVMDSNRPNTVNQEGGSYRRTGLTTSFFNNRFLFGCIN